MATIQIKNVPESVHQEMHRRAKRAGQSLQRYLLEDLCRRSETVPLDEWLDEAGSRRGSKLTSAQIVAMIREDRESH